jgi:serine/threonine protein kinase
MYAVVGQDLALSPRWMLIWYGTILLLNVSSFGLLNLLIFEVGGELYSKMRAEQRTDRYRDRFFNEREESRALKEGWKIDGNSVQLKNKNDPIGEGTSGTVYEALWDPLSDQNACVAVKVLKGSSSSLEHGERDPMDLASLDKEIELMQRLSHPRLVHFFGAGRLGIDAVGTHEGSKVPTLSSANFNLNPEQVGCVFLLTELMAGGDLGQLISEQPVYSEALQDRHKKDMWSWSARLRILSDIASGMQYLHSHSVAHRDLKPGNILLDRRRRRAKVADFGLAKLLRKKSKRGRGRGHRKRNPLQSEAPDEFDYKKDEGSLKSQQAQPLFTSDVRSFATGRIGSAAYMSPELWLGERVQVDQYKADVFAMSVCMWRVMECPRMPYVAQGWQPQFNAQLKHMVAEQDLRPLFGEELEEAVARSEEWKQSSWAECDEGDGAGDDRRGATHDTFLRHMQCVPEGFVDLMTRAWDTDAGTRPTMKEISRDLSQMLTQLEIGERITVTLRNQPPTF